MAIRSVCVYCASSRETPDELLHLADEVGRLLAARGIRLVYGGAGVGMMGAVANGCLGAGGEVLGVIPEALKLREVVHHNLTELLVTADMSQRKMAMFDASDAFVALPGGVGTLEELTEIISWKNLGVHRRPIIILNHKRFFDPLLAQYAEAQRRGVMAHGVEQAWSVVGAPREMMGQLR